MEAADDTEETDDRIGRYRVLGRLGSGGMASVDLAEVVGPGGFQKLVALKRILPDQARESTFISMFFDEARIASRIQHPNVVTIHELGEENGTLYMALEYVHGESLAVVMDRIGGPIPLPHVAHIGAQLCDGLHAAHELRGSDGVSLGVVHRDVSPQNVLISYDGFVKLSDFGIAKARGSLAITPTGGLKGKFAYLSPEQVVGRELDRRSDVFALGIMLWETSVGRRLFPADDLFETLRLVKDQRIPPPSEIVPGYPASLEAVIVKALERDRDRRWASTHEMQLALEAVSRGQGWTGGRVDLGRFMQWLVPERAGLSPRERSAHIALATTALADDAATTQVKGIDARRAPSRREGSTHVLPDPGAVAAAVSRRPSDAPSATNAGVESKRLVLLLCALVVVAALVGAGYALIADRVATPQETETSSE
jgi:serine/threonine-protein kinase